ncbi:MAG: tyrosine-type recombinase/integrase [Victivallales bacterium]
MKKDGAKLFCRGKKGTYYFRKRDGTKDIWISTRTTEKTKAQKYLDSYENTENAKDVILDEAGSGAKVIQRISSVLTKKITKKEFKKTSILDAYEKWTKSYDKFMDISQARRDFFSSIIKKFSDWAGEEGRKITDIEDVTPEIAKQYARYLWDDGYSSKTFNDHIYLLSRVFTFMDDISSLPYRDPFNKRRVTKKTIKDAPVEGRHPLEPKMLKDVLDKSAEYGKDYRDLFIIGAHTGMRLKDAVLLRWQDIDGNFITFSPRKTIRTSNVARVPITPVLRRILKDRKDNSSEYVIPELADKYLNIPGSICEKAKDIFDKALGKENTRIQKGDHRRIRTSRYSFSSYRSTYMSMLAAKNVSTRDAMRALGWNSPAMIRTYEHELEKAKREADKRALGIVGKIKEFRTPPPKLVKKLRPNEDALEKLVSKYSNLTIARIYGISNVAIKKWLDKFGIVRKKRIESADVVDEEIERIREELLVAGD